MIRMDAGLDFNSEVQAFHYLLSGSNAKFILSGNDKGIMLTERSKRIYRGDMELGNLNGSLSVINVVPLEQYLYAVVGRGILRLAGGGAEGPGCSGTQLRVVPREPLRCCQCGGYNAQPGL